MTHKLQERAGVIAADCRRIAEVLRPDRQALWSALRLSMTRRFGYLQQNVAHSLTEPVARELDTALWEILETACGLKTPRGEEQGSLCLRIPAVLFSRVGSAAPRAAPQLGFLEPEGELRRTKTAIPFMTGRHGVCRALHSVKNH